MSLFATYRPGFSTFEDAMREVLATALATPEFLYLTQRAAAEEAPEPAMISELELASRLSVFLWSSLPDDELLDLLLQRIDLLVVINHRRGRHGIAGQNGLRRGGHLGFHDAAHVRDQAVQALQFLVEALDQMFRGVGHDIVSVPV